MLGLVFKLAMTSLALTSAPLASMNTESTAPAPQVLAWASFLGEDETITSSSQWSSGNTWNPLVGNWAQVNGFAVTTRSTANARAVANVPTAGNSSRVVALVSSRNGTAVQSGGVVAAAATSGTRVALTATIVAGGSLEIRSIRGGTSALLATSGTATLLQTEVEISLQLLDGMAIATARSLSEPNPELHLTATLTPTQIADHSGTSAYGVVASSTTNVAFRALRVETPP